MKLLSSRYTRGYWVETDLFLKVCGRFIPLKYSSLKSAFENNQLTSFYVLSIHIWPFEVWYVWNHPSHCLCGDEVMIHISSYRVNTSSPKCPSVKIFIISSLVTNMLRYFSLGLLIESFNWNLMVTNSFQKLDYRQTPFIICFDLQ